MNDDRHGMFGKAADARAALRAWAILAASVVVTFAVAAVLVE